MSQKFQPHSADDFEDSMQYLGQLTRRGHYAREAEIAALKSRVEEQDRLLAEAADFLNHASRMDAMDFGAVITAYRLAQQKSVAPSLETRGDAT
jgi:Asp-tRNA(Asn)/Glu-tRNA(Gln) amidotransferase C subunit